METGELNVRVGYSAGAVCAGGAGAEEVRCAAVWRRAVPVRHGDILVRSARMRPDLLRPPHHRARLRLALPTTGAAHLAAPPSISVQALPALWLLASLALYPRPLSLLWPTFLLWPTLLWLAMPRQALRL